MEEFTLMDLLWALMVDKQKQIAQKNKIFFM
jgi:hypothetical protein